MRDMSVQSLRWAVGLFCAFAGALALVVPHNFDTPPYAALRAQLSVTPPPCALA